MFIKIKFVQNQIGDLEYNEPSTTTLEQLEEKIKTRDRQQYFETNPTHTIHFIFRSRVWNDKTVNLEEIGIQDGMSIIAYCLRPSPQVQNTEQPQQNNVFTSLFNQPNNSNTGNNFLSSMLNNILGGNPDVSQTGNYQTFNIPLMDIYSNRSVEENLQANNLPDTPAYREIIERNINQMRNQVQPQAQQPQNNQPPLNNPGNPPSFFSSLLNNFPMANQPQNQQQNQNNETQYQSRIEEIQSMGFTQSRGEILDALRQARGSVDAAIDILFSSNN